MMWEQLQREPLSTTLEFMHACIPLGTFIYIYEVSDEEVVAQSLLAKDFGVNGKLVK